jgi:hypothetical protein
MKNTLTRRPDRVGDRLCFADLCAAKRHARFTITPTVVALVKANTDALDKNDAAADGSVLTDSFRYA